MKRFFFEAQVKKVSSLETDLIFSHLQILPHPGEREPDCDAGADHDVLQHQRLVTQDQLHENE